VAGAVYLLRMDARLRRDRGLGVAASRDRGWLVLFSPGGRAGGFRSQGGKLSRAFTRGSLGYPILFVRLCGLQCNLLAV